MTLINREKPCCDAPSCTHGGKLTPKSLEEATPASAPISPPVAPPISPPAPPTGYPSSSSPKPLPRAVACGNIGENDWTRAILESLQNDTDDDVREAVSKVHEEIDHLLIDMGANVNAKDKQGVTIAPPSLPSSKIKVEGGRIAFLDSVDREFAKPFQLSDHKTRGIDSADLFIAHRTSSPTRTADDFADQSNSPSADQSNSQSIETTGCTIA